MKEKETTEQSETDNAGATGETSTSEIEQKLEALQIPDESISPGETKQDDDGPGPLEIPESTQPQLEHSECPASLPLDQETESHSPTDPQQTVIPSLQTPEITTPSPKGGGPVEVEVEDTIDPSAAPPLESDSPGVTECSENENNLLAAEDENGDADADATPKPTPTLTSSSVEMEDESTPRPMEKGRERATEYRSTILPWRMR